MANRKLLDKLYKSLEEVPDDADVTAVIGLIAYKGEQDDQLPTGQAYGGRARGGAGATPSTRGPRTRCTRSRQTGPSGGASGKCQSNANGSLRPHPWVWNHSTRRKHLQPAIVRSFAHTVVVGNDSV